MENAKPTLRIVPKKRDYEDLEAEQNRWRITREEAARRVAALRTELESYRAQIEALPFDIPVDDMPDCLDETPRKWLVDLVEDLAPVVEGLFKRCDTVAEQCGAYEVIDYNAELFSLKMRTAETGYCVGVLAGVMFSGASKETIDRFERGLLFAICSNRWIVAGEEKGESHA